MRSLYSKLTRAEAVLAAVLLMLMVLLIFFGGFARMMRMPQNWTIDLATCFFAWAAFLCADIAWRRDLLMSITLVPERLPARFQRALTFFNLALVTAFLLFLLGQGVYLTWASRARTFNGISRVSFSWVTASLPVGAALMLVTTWLKFRAALRGETVLGAPHADDALNQPG
jgi:TRAP-type C4-dicarboxylate transport system permease small subunit